LNSSSNSLESTRTSCHAQAAPDNKT